MIGWRRFCPKVLVFSLSIIPFGLVSTAMAAPRIDSLSLRGLQSGGTTTLVVTGADLAPDPRLVLPVADTQTKIIDAKPTQVTIEVTLPATASPGLFTLRIARESGLSNPILIGVDALPQRPMETKTESLPVAYHGQITGTAIAKTTFHATKGQRIVIDVEAQRLGGKLNPVIELLDTRMVPIAWAQGVASLAGDARLVTTIPNDGEYSVQLHDLQYQGAGPGHFRMKIGDLSFADFTFPMGVQVGKDATVQIPGLEAAAVSVTVPGTTALGFIPLSLPPNPNQVGPSPAVYVDSIPEVVEPQLPDSMPLEVETPVAISGWLTQKRETDRYKIAVKAGTKYRFEVFANSLGTPVDAVLSIQNDQGGQLAGADDRPGTTDPMVDFDVPQGTTHVVATVSDLLGRGGPEYLYRLRVVPVPERDFELKITSDQLSVPQQGVALLQVDAVRRGYNGPIGLSIPGLPASVVMAGAEIPPGRTRSLLTIAAGEQLALSQQVVTVRGTATKLPGTPSRDALLPESSASKFQPWLRGEVGLSVTPAGPLTVAWQSSEAEMAVGFNTGLAVMIKRQDSVTGAVRLSLVTSQIPPPIADGPDKGKPDVNRTIRVDGMPQIAADQSQGTLSVIVPGDLPQGPYDLVVQAELLAADGKVLATALTPSLRVQAVSAVQLNLAGEPKVEAKSGEGPTGVLKGNVRRLLDLDRPVVVKLTGLPKEIPAPEITIPAGQSEFEFPVSFPFGTPVGELKNVKVVASTQLEANRVVSSNELAVAVAVVQGNPPPPPGPLFKVFEDEPFFLALLYEGDGKADLERTDRFSGETALKITTNQRFRAKMPAWEYKIAENPQEGEFRYIRFAWKKQGGDNILLQFNANGGWGPARGQAGPTFRYEAGPKTNSFNVSATQISDQLPATWTVVTRDLFADFGAFTLSGLALTPGPGEYGLFDHVYLARTMDDFKTCPQAIEPQPPLAIFDDEADFPAKLTDGNGQMTLDTADKFAGSVSLKITPEQRYNTNLPGLGIKIRKNPGDGEYRYLRYAWKKNGGSRICLQINHDGIWGPNRQFQNLKFRYDAGTGPESYSAAVRLQEPLPTDWQVITRDLFADFGEFTFTGLALSPIDGEAAWFDHLYLAKTPRDFDLVHPQAAK